MERKADEVLAFRCVYCGALYAEREMAEACADQCVRVLAESRFSADAMVVTTRGGDTNAMRVLNKRIRRDFPGRRMVVYTCEDCNGKAAIFPSHVLISKPSNDGAA